MRYYLSPPPLGPVSRVFAAVVASLALAGALFFGFVVLFVLMGMVLIFGLIFWLRSKWILRHRGAVDVSNTQSQEGARVIDAEYTVISRRRD